VQHDSINGGEHFPTAHIDDLAGRASQLMVARFAHALFSHTYAPLKSCSYCFNPCNHASKCPFIRHYKSIMDDVSNSYHEHVEVTTILESEEIVDNNEEEEKEEQVEHTEQVEPLADTSLSNDKEMSTEAPSFIIVPRKTLHEVASRTRVPMKLIPLHGSSTIVFVLNCCSLRSIICIGSSSYAMFG
jgi:hypothetical protein